MSETRNAGRGPGSQPTAHLCPAGGCRAKVRADRLMCAPHWRLVPYRLRAVVWATWRSGAGAGSPEHRDACAAAVAAVDEVLEVFR
jgi:hypothetical protein